MIYAKWFVFCDRCGLEDTDQPDRDTALSRFNRFESDPETILCDDCVDALDPTAKKALL